MPLSLHDDGIAWVDRDAGEWREMRTRLGRLVGAPSQECAEHGEDWQYMGTVFRGVDGRAPTWRHEFRHRCGASCDGIGRGNRCESLPASPGWTPAMTTQSARKG